MQDDNPHASRPECGSKTRNGTPCKNAPMANGRCRMHGGKTPTGVALPQTNTGRYSKYLPQNLLPSYIESLGDPELFNLRDNIALTNARIIEQLQALQSSDPVARWSDLADAWRDVDRARTAKDGAALSQAFTRMRELITEGMGEQAVWTDIFNLMERQRRFVESERKRMVEMQQVITSDRVMLLFSRLGGILNERVSSRAELAAIHADIRGLLAGPPERAD